MPARRVAGWSNAPSVANCTGQSSSTEVAREGLSSSLYCGCCDARAGCLAGPTLKRIRVQLCSMAARQWQRRRRQRRPLARVHRAGAGKRERQLSENWEKDVTASHCRELPSDSRAAAASISFPAAHFQREVCEDLSEDSRGREVLEFMDGRVTPIHGLARYQPWQLILWQRF